MSSTENLKLNKAWSLLLVCWEEWSQCSWHAQKSRLRGKTSNSDRKIFLEVKHPVGFEGQVDVKSCERNSGKGNIKCESTRYDGVHLERCIQMQRCDGMSDLRLRVGPHQEEFE